MKTYKVIHNPNSLTERKFTIEITTRYNLFGWKIEKVVPYRVGVSSHIRRTMRFKTDADAQSYIANVLQKL